MFGIPDLDASAKASQVKTIVFWQWFEEQSMSRRRSDAAAAVVGRKVSLIFLLGFNENIPRFMSAEDLTGWSQQALWKFSIPMWVPGPL